MSLLSFFLASNNIKCGLFFCFVLFLGLFHVFAFPFIFHFRLFNTPSFFFFFYLPWMCNSDIFAWNMSFLKYYLFLFIRNSFFLNENKYSIGEKKLDQRKAKWMMARKKGKNSLYIYFRYIQFIYFFRVFMLTNLFSFFLSLVVFVCHCGLFPSPFFSFHYCDFVDCVQVQTLIIWILTTSWWYNVSKQKNWKNRKRSWVFRMLLEERKKWMKE